MAMDLPPLELPTNDWHSYVDHIYDVYLDTIIKSNLRFRNVSVKPRYTPVTHGKHYGFWHITSDGYIEEDRLPDFSRCERIRWIQWMIEEHSHLDWWYEKRKNKREVVIWHEAEQYVVILSERRDYWLLKTAYIADKSRKIRQLKRSRDKYCNP